LRNPETGGQYRKTLQYGYDRQQGVDRWMGQKLNGLDPWKYSPEQSAEVYAEMYACGFLKPHYNVPAIKS
jgi:hypothetical protein